MRFRIFTSALVSAAVVSVLSATVALDAGAAEAASSAADRRLRSWPKLESWLGGNNIEREPTLARPDEDSMLVDDGRALFRLYCSNCHGVTGRGDGPRSPLFDPAPRDLTQGLFKFRSTPTGTLPTRQDLFLTVTGGIRGTGMMPFADLSEYDRWSLVAYVRTLAPEFLASGHDGESLDLPDAPRNLASERRIRRGEIEWTALGCASCHGEKGRGNGPAAATLEDNVGRPVRMPDFALRPFKRGAADEELFLTLVTGLDGTPMPSYRDATSDRALWDLVAFIRTLETPPLDQVDKLDRVEATAYINGQYAQAKHAVVGGCGCSARKRRAGTD